MKRRTFALSVGGGIVSRLFSGTPAAGISYDFADAPAFPVKNGESPFNELPNFCAHEHWGSIDSIGQMPGGYRADFEAGAIPMRRTGVTDIVLDPYLGGWINSTGFSPAEAAKAAGYESVHTWWNGNSRKAIAALKTHLERQRFSGTFQCIRRGVHALHGIDIGDLTVDSWLEADRQIAGAYEKMFMWYRRTMKKAGFSELIRPVHPEFYYSNLGSDTSSAELSFTNTIFRIDPLLSFWRSDSPRRDTLAGLTGVEPADTASWRRFIAALFDHAGQKGTTGIKQLQAYSRNLDFPAPADNEIVWRGELAEDAVRRFQNWVVNECCRQANERGWVHQVHVGTHNLPDSSPLPLQGLARRYPDMKLVMIHCWPFIDEAGWIAKHMPNAYIDTCWMPVLNPEFYRLAITRWLNYVPGHKIMCSHDSTSIEMAAGSALFTREILHDCLEAASGFLHFNRADTMRTAAQFLQNNAIRVYGFGMEADA